jgi:hypothetical protein
MTSEDLVTYVRELGSLPDGRFSPTEILSFANNEQLNVCKDIISVRQDFLVETATVAVTSVSNSFRIPPRALGGKVRDIVIQLNPGSFNTPGQYVAVPRIDISDRFANPVGYFYQGNSIVMWNVSPAISSPSAVVLVSYYARPGLLIPTGSALLVTTVDATNGAVTGSGATMVGNTTLDIIKGSPGFESLRYNETTYVPAGLTVGSIGQDIAGVEVGDWVSPSGYSPVIQLPLEFHQVLAQRTIVKALDSIGDEAGFQRAQAKATEMQGAALELIAERDDGTPEKLRMDVFSPWVRQNRWVWPR